APDRVPGGSSSGSAVAVGAGLVDFSLGSDAGGSARVPASYSGISGFRPSHDVISTYGVTHMAHSFDPVGKGKNRYLNALEINLIRMISLSFLKCSKRIFEQHYCLDTNFWFRMV
ncbi:Amidase, partial [Parasponia andersonii]